MKQTQVDRKKNRKEDLKQCIKILREVLYKDLEAHEVYLVEALIERYEDELGRVPGVTH